MDQTQSKREPRSPSVGIMKNAPGNGNERPGWVGGVGFFFLVGETLSHRSAQKKTRPLFFVCGFVQIFHCLLFFFWVVCFLWGGLVFFVFFFVRGVGPFVFVWENLNLEEGGCRVLGTLVPWCCLEEKTR